MQPREISLLRGATLPQMLPAGPAADTQPIWTQLPSFLTATEAELNSGSTA